MRIAIFLLAIALVGCGPVRSLRKAQKAVSTLQQLAKEHPELIDTIKLITRDSVKTEPLHANIVLTTGIDSAMVDSLARVLCDELRASDQPTNDTVFRDRPDLTKRSSARRKLLNAVCPPMSLDTVLNVRIFNTTFNRELPINLSVSTVAGRLQINVDVKAIKIPDEKTKTTVVIGDGPPFYKVPWFWSTLVFVMLFMLLATRRATGG